MNITDLFGKVLKTPLRISRQSWGAYNSVTDVVILRLWSDDIVSSLNRRKIAVLSEGRHSDSWAQKERRGHLERIANGAQAFAVLCESANTPPGQAKKIKSFNVHTLLVLGQMSEQDRVHYMDVAGEIPLARFAEAMSERGDAASDIWNLSNAKGLTVTERIRLASARVGQGLYREQMLKIWDYKCAVTGCGVLEAIRASHAKPWAISTNIERLDANNGLPLIATLDALFDAAMIAFDVEGKMHISAELTLDHHAMFGIPHSLRIKPKTSQAKY